MYCIFLDANTTQKAYLVFKRQASLKFDPQTQSYILREGKKVSFLSTHDHCHKLPVNSFSANYLALSRHIARKGRLVCVPQMSDFFP